MRTGNVAHGAVVRIRLEQGLTRLCMVVLFATVFSGTASVLLWAEVYQLKAQNSVQLIVIMMLGAKIALKDFQEPGGTVPATILI